MEFSAQQKLLAPEDGDLSEPKATTSGMMHPSECIIQMMQVSERITLIGRHFTFFCKTQDYNSDFKMFRILGKELFVGIYTY